MTTSPTARAPVACGVAGWSYPDWRETVYRQPPAPVRQPTLFDLPAARPAAGRAPAPVAPLTYLAGFVDMVEVNSSFYRIPTPAVTAGWARQVAAVPGFFFTAKLHQAFTHEGRCEASLAAQFREALTPLREAGRLRALLAQFRYDAADTPSRRRDLSWMAAQFGALAPLVVEVRHVSWQSPSGVAFLRDLGVSIAVLDYPTARDSFTARDNLGAPAGYYRLHGRNYAAWFASRDGKAPHEPYDYNYSDAEIGELAETARALLPQVRSLTIVANNHYRGKGLSTALRLKSELSGQRVAVPPALLAAYPALERIAGTQA